MNPSNSLQIGSRSFPLANQAYLMGIVNVTPDSFSDGGKYTDLTHILSCAETMIQEGAAILDIGGESTRPGYAMISTEEEIARVVPVIAALKQQFDIPISIDTYKPAVADAAIAAGADLVNDIWGLQYDAQMAQVIAKHQVACCLMHNRTTPIYTDFLQDCLTDLQKSLHLAQDAGIAPNHILVDPGVGFAKSYEQNLTVLRHLDAFGSLGYPVLLGASRKSVIGLTLDLPVNERLEGTIATTVAAVLQGCSFIRVHDIRANKRALEMAVKLKYG